MKLLLTFLLPITLGLFSFDSFAQQEQIDITGKWLRDDSKIRIIKHVEDGIILTTEDQEYFYKEIALNKYQMNWTPSEYGGQYRWTMTVKDGKEFSNFFEKFSGTYTRTRNYVLILNDTANPAYLSFE